MNTLAIIPCSSKKAWGRRPTRFDPNPPPIMMPMRSAYIGSFHRLTLEYAELVSDTQWILSAKHGLRTPDFEITEYDVTWGSYLAIGDFDLSAQAILGMTDLIGAGRGVDRVLVIAGSRYVARVVSAFSEIKEIVIVPVLQEQKLAGIGFMQAWLRQQIDAINEGDSQ